jgi:D-alanyl-D-alanine carboxypeptidase
MKKFILYIMAILISGVVSFANAATPGDDLDKQLQQLLDQTRKDNGIVNMSMSVSLDANSATRNYVSGTLQQNGTEKVAPDTLFQIGSITKSFTAAVILQLESEGKLSIDDTVDKYLPNEYPKWNNVTLIQLMNMTSGIYDYVDPYFGEREIYNPSYRHKTWQLHELADYAYNKHSDLKFPPGTNWEYTNTAYILLGMIIEQVTGHTVDYEFNSRLLGDNSQLGLLNTYYLPYSPNDYPPDIQNRLAHDYKRIYPDKTISDITDIDLSMASTAGAMISDPKDIIIWVRDLFNNKVLPAKQFKEMTTEYWYLIPEDVKPKDAPGGVYPANTYYGFGLMATKNFSPQKNYVINGYTWWYQGGTLGGTFIFVLLPDNTVINIASGNPLDEDSNFYLFLNNAFVEQVIMTVENYKNLYSNQHLLS